MRPVPSALICAPVTSVPGQRSNTMALSTWESVCSWATRERCVGIDPHHDLAIKRDLLVEEVPDDVVDGLDAGHRDEAAGVLDRPDVADLATAAGVERRPVEHDPSGGRADDHGTVFVEIRLLVTQVDGHGPNLSRPRHDDGGTITTGHGALRSSRPASPGWRDASPTTTTVHGSR